MTDHSEIIEMADAVVLEFVERHGMKAVPALLGACVNLAVQIGAPALIKDSLRNAITLTDEMHAAWVKNLS